MTALLVKVRQGSTVHCIRHFDTFTVLQTNTAVTVLPYGNTVLLFEYYCVLLYILYCFFSLLILSICLSVCLSICLSVCLSLVYVYETCCLI